MPVVQIIPVLTMYVHDHVAVRSSGSSRVPLGEGDRTAISPGESCSTQSCSGPELYITILGPVPTKKVLENVHFMNLFEGNAPT